MNGCTSTDNQSYTTSGAHTTEINEIQASLNECTSADNQSDTTSGVHATEINEIQVSLNECTLTENQSDTTSGVHATEINETQTSLNICSPVEFRSDSIPLDQSEMKSQAHVSDHEIRNENATEQMIEDVQRVIDKWHKE